MLNSTPPPPPVPGDVIVDSPRAWGAGNAADKLKATSKFVLHQAPAYPCLDVLYPGKFRFHCQRCSDDAAISKFSRHRFYLFYGFTEEGGEKLYRLPMALANSYVEGCARGRLRPGMRIKAVGDVIVAAPGPMLPPAEQQLQESDDSIPALCGAVVGSKYDMFIDGVEAYVLQSVRIPPYLLVVHENSTPSAIDIKAFENNYSLEFVQKLDEEYNDALVKSFKR